LVGQVGSAVKPIFYTWRQVEGLKPAEIRHL